jgi:hypothetical protein
LLIDDLHNAIIGNRIHLLNATGSRAGCSWWLESFRAESKWLTR